MLVALCTSALCSHTNAETDVVLQLIQYYPWLFDVDREKLAVNDLISEVQELIEQGAYAKKSAGDIRTWIFSEPADQDIAVEVCLSFFLPLPLKNCFTSFTFVVRSDLRSELVTYCPFWKHRMVIPASF